MPGPPPKDPATRQRKNKATSAATLPPEPESIAPVVESGVPELPPKEEGWHPRALEFWNHVWTSPMAAGGKYLRADMQGLYVLVDLVDQYWTAARAERPALAAEIRLQRVPYGLTPYDRNRLQWKVEDAKPVAKAESPAPKRAAFDPRKVLEMGKR